MSEGLRTVEGRRITLRFGSLTRKYILVAPPYPHVGEELAIEGEGAKWRVTAVRVVPVGTILANGGAR